MTAQERPRPDKPADDETIAALETALHSLARRLRQAMLKDYLAQQAGHDLDQAGLAILYVLQGEPAPPRISDVAARLGIDPPAVTRKAQQLERDGLVSRARDADDARASRLRLTADGEHMLTSFQLARHQWLTSVLSDWSPGDCEQLARLMRRFTDDIDRHLDELSC
jgi:DNA-binding MarR family transcriptional regulator